jgi:hypothetical protein
MNPIEFTKDEARVLLAMIDIAVKTAGLQAAESAVVLSKKINAAMIEEAAPLAIVE